MARQRTEIPGEFCFCGGTQEQHIGGKPCTRSPRREVRSVYDLPIAGWAWRGDAAVLERN